ncbi:MAG TPA: DUF1553 domain-containing protein, partial [Blastocatellia bacterium]|nr:DUF1553 domain-containing protein [Blastocatellia bacterium]
NHMINYEGGAIPEEYQVEYVVDRVETTSNVWMATTMGCARCHSHKYDPITQKEFYQFFAFFNTVSEEGLDGKTGNAKPFLALPSEQQKARLEALTSSIKVKEAFLASKEVVAAQEEWEKPLTGKPAAAKREGLLAHYELDGNFSDVSGAYRQGRTVRGDPTFDSGRAGKAVSFDGDTHVSFNKTGSFDTSDSFTIAMWLRGSGNTPIAVMQKIDGPRTRRGYEFVLDDIVLIGIQRRAARLTVRLTSQWPESAVEIRTRNRLNLGNWYHLALTSDGSGKAAGVKLYIDGKLHDAEITRDSLAGSIATDAELQVGSKELGSPFRGGLDDLRLYSLVLNEEEIRQLARDYPVQTILSGISGKRSKEETARLRDYFLTRVADEKVKTEYEALKALRKEKEQLEKEIPTVMVMSEMQKPRETFVLGRGDYRNRTERVTGGVPSVLPALRPEAKPDRLALARWLVDPSHPLTARVTVNRFWQMYFGAGIVKTSENFGFQGEAPVHPELLDWLATEFMRTGWDIRAMQRLIVTSAAYRQSSKVTQELREKDPDNRLLARGPRFRLPAETVRDNALAISGLLNDKIGGPSVFPYQPKGLWDELAFGDGFSAQVYTPSSGRDLYRRSLYTFWKRTVPPPQLATFDAPDREKCTDRRALTNTPLQALVLLNDPTYIEAARALAERALTGGRKGGNERIEFVFRSATARKPSAIEAHALQSLLRQQLVHYRRDREAALKLLGVGESKWNEKIDASELAAWTMVASSILNLDETITKE